MARSELDIILRVVDKGSSQLKKFQTAITATAVALGAARVAGEVWQAAIAGAQMKKAEKSFASMAKGVGQDIHEIAEAMQDASGGAVSMQESMEMASQAIRLGVAQTPEEFANLARAATNLGAAMGRGPVEAMQDIVRGIGRMSPLILDNIGIMTNGGQVFEDYAAAVGKTAKELTDTEKKQALLNLAIADGNKLVDAEATGFERLDVAMKDSMDTLKKGLSESLEPTAGTLADIVIHTNELESAMRLLGYGVGIGGQRVDRFGEAIYLSDEAVMALAETLSGIGERITDFGGRFQGLQGDVEGASGAMGGLVSSFSDVTQASLASEGLDALNKAAEEGLVDQEEYEETFRELATSLDISAAQQDAHLKFAAIKSDMEDGILKTEDYIDALFRLQDALRFGTLGGGGGDGETDTGMQQQHGGTFTVPPGFPNDSFRAGFSSGETVTTQNDERSYFGNSTVNINNGTGMDAFEEILRNIQ